MSPRVSVGHEQSLEARLGVAITRRLVQVQVVNKGRVGIRLFLSLNHNIRVS